MKIRDAIKKLFKKQKQEFLYVEGHLEFSQERDSCDPGKDEDLQSLRATIENGGGGYYWVLKTDRWAVDKDDKRVEKCLSRVLKSLRQTYDWR